MESRLRNFLSLLWIFLNEFHKLALALGLITAPPLENPDLKDSKKNRVFSEDLLSASLKPASRLQSVQLLTNKLEALFVFVLANSMVLIDFPSFQRFLHSQIRQLLPSSPSFACDVNRLILAREKPLTNYCFDLVNGHWVLWSRCDFPSIERLNTEFASTNLKTQELVRLNPELLHLEAVQTQLENEQVEGFLYPQRKRFEPTLNALKAGFFLNYLIAYSKKVALVGPRHCGKSALLENKTARLLTLGDFRVIKTGVLRNKTMADEMIGGIVRFLKENTAIKGVNMSGNRALWIVEDMNLEGQMRVVNGVRSLITRGQWLSNAKTLTAVDRKALSIIVTVTVDQHPKKLNFIETNWRENSEFSLRQSEEEIGSPKGNDIQNLNERRLFRADLLSLLEKTTVLEMEDLSTKDLYSIFQLQIPAPNIENSTIHSVLTQLALNFAFICDRLRSEPSFQGLLSLSSFLSISRSLSHFQLDPEAKETHSQVSLFLLEKHCLTSLFPLDLDSLLQDQEKSIGEFGEISEMDESSCSSETNDIGPLGLSSMEQQDTEEQMDLLGSPSNRLSSSPRHFTSSKSFRKRSIILTSPYRNQLYRAGSIAFKKDEASTNENYLLNLRKKTKKSKLDFSSSAELLKSLIKFTEKVLNVKPGFYKNLRSTSMGFFNPHRLKDTEEPFNDDESSSSGHQQDLMVPVPTGQEKTEIEDLIIMKYNQSKESDQVFQEFNETGFSYFVLELLFLLEGGSEGPIVIISEFSEEATKQLTGFCFKLAGKGLRTPDSEISLIEFMNEVLENQLGNKEFPCLYFNARGNRENFTEIIEVLICLNEGYEPELLRKKCFEDFYIRSKGLPAYKGLNKSHFLHIFKARLQRMRVILDIGGELNLLEALKERANFEISTLFLDKTRYLGKTRSSIELKKVYQAELELQKSLHRGMLIGLMSLHEFSSKFRVLSQRFRSFLEEKLDNERKAGFCGKLLGLKEAKIEKFSKDLRKTQVEKDRAETRLRELTDRLEEVEKKLDETAREEEQSLEYEVRPENKIQLLKSLYKPEEKPLERQESGLEKKEETNLLNQLFQSQGPSGEPQEQILEQSQEYTLEKPQSNYLEPQETQLNLLEIQRGYSKTMETPPASALLQSPAHISSPLHKQSLPPTLASRKAILEERLLQVTSELENQKLFVFGLSRSLEKKRSLHKQLVQSLIFLDEALAQQLQEDYPFIDNPRLLVQLGEALALRLLLVSRHSTRFATALIQRTEAFCFGEEGMNRQVREFLKPGRIAEILLGRQRLHEIWNSFPGANVRQLERIALIAFSIENNLFPMRVYDPLGLVRPGLLTLFPNKTRFMIDTQEPSNVCLVQEQTLRTWLQGKRLPFNRVVGLSNKPLVINASETLSLEVVLDVDDPMDFQQVAMDLFSRRWAEDSRKRAMKSLRRPGFFIEKAKSLDFLVKDLERVEPNSQDSIIMLNQALIETFGVSGKAGTQGEKGEGKPGFFEVLEQELSLVGLDFKELTEGIWKLRNCLKKLENFSEEETGLESQFYILLRLIVERTDFLSLENVPTIL